METVPSWMSTENEYSLDVNWADFNNDGYLDLAFAGTSCPNRIYFSQGGVDPDDGRLELRGCLDLREHGGGGRRGRGRLDRPRDRRQQPARRLREVQGLRETWGHGTLATTADLAIRSGRLRIARLAHRHR